MSTKGQVRNKSRLKRPHEKKREAIMIPVKPVPCPRLTHRGKFTDRAKRYHQYMNQVRLLTTAGKFEPTDRLEMVFYMPIPKSWTKKKKKEMWDTPHQQKPDLDNLIKGVLDSLFLDKGGDANVYEIQAKKVWTHIPGIYIRNVGKQ